MSTGQPLSDQVFAHHVAIREYSVYNNDRTDFRGWTHYMECYMNGHTRQQREEGQ